MQTREGGKIKREKKNQKDTARDGRMRKGRESEKESETEGKKKFEQREIHQNRDGDRQCNRESKATSGKCSVGFGFWYLPSFCSNFLVSHISKQYSSQHRQIKPSTDFTLLRQNSFPIKTWLSCTKFSCDRSSRVKFALGYRWRRHLLPGTDSKYSIFMLYLPTS